MVLFPKTEWNYKNGTSKGPQSNVNWDDFSVMSPSLKLTHSIRDSPAECSVRTG